MGKIQTRRSVSMKAETFVRLQRLSAWHALSMSELVEALVDEKCDDDCIPKVERADALAALGIENGGLTDGET